MTCRLPVESSRLSSSVFGYCKANQKLKARRLTTQSETMFRNHDWWTFQSDGVEPKDVVNNGCMELHIESADRMVDAYRLGLVSS